MIGNKKTLQTLHKTLHSLRISLIIRALHCVGFEAEILHKSCIKPALNPTWELRVKETKRQRDKETKRQRDKETKRQRVKETKRQRVKETKSQRDKESKSQRDKESKRQRVKEAGPTPTPP